MSSDKRTYSARLAQIGFSGLRNKSRDSVLKLATDLIEKLKKKAIKRTAPRIGALYHYMYDAKLKDVLPYWDRMPVTLPIEIYDDGFLGLNFHYIHPLLRAKLLDKLESIYSSVGNDETRRLQVSYAMLKSASGIPQFRPCIKRYLINHVKSPLFEIPRSDWFAAVVLPVARFQKASLTTVYANARKQIAR